MHWISDVDYKSKWPRPIPQEYIDAGIYLKSLTPAEELADFLAMRGHCLLANDRLREAIDTFKWACKLEPHNTLRRAFWERLVELWQQGQRATAGSYYVPPRRHKEPIKWPQWLHVNGQRLLVQYPQSRDTESASPMEIGRSTTRQNLRMPDGKNGGFLLPNCDTSTRLEAFWVETGFHEYVLVHRPLEGAHTPVDLRQLGKPIVPNEPTQGTMRPVATPGLRSNREAPRLLPHEITSLKRRIAQVKQHGNAFVQDHRLPPSQDLRQLPGQPTKLLRLHM